MGGEVDMQYISSPYENCGPIKNKEKGNGGKHPGVGEGGLKRLNPTTCVSRK